MGKNLNILGGMFAILLGIWGLFAWLSLFVGLLKATVPAILILGGIIALIAGVSEIKDESASKKEKTEEKK